MMMLDIKMINLIILERASVVRSYDESPTQILFINYIFYRAYTETIFETRTQDSFSDCGLCLCHLLFETNSFGLGAVLLSYLVSELQEPPSPGLQLRTIFQSFPKCLPASRNKHAKFGAN
jgi:hypothetical protein